MTEAELQALKEIEQAHTEATERDSFDSFALRDWAADNGAALIARVHNQAATIEALKAEKAELEAENRALKVVVRCAKTSTAQTLEMLALADKEGFYKSESEVPASGA